MAGRDGLRAWARGCWAGLLLLAWGAVHAAQEQALRLPGSGVEIVSQRYPASGPVLVLWLTGQDGRVEAEHRAADFLARQGVETWVTDFLAPYFLPLLPSSVAQVPDADLAAWLEAVRRANPERHLILVAPGHLAGLALRATVAWRRQAGGVAGGLAKNPFAGALLLFPLLYQDLQPGQEPAYAPVVDQARLDLVILQPRASAGYWWRERLQARLEAGGSRVWMTVLDGLRDGFYRRGDASAEEQAAGARLGAIVLDGLAPLLNASGADKAGRP